MTPYEQAFHEGEEASYRDRMAGEQRRKPAGELSLYARAFFDGYTPRSTTWRKPKTVQPKEEAMANQVGSPNLGVTDFVREAVKAEGGLDCAEQSRFPRKTALRIASTLCKRGEVFRGRVSHNIVRYFATQEAADEWVARAMRNPIKQKPRKSVAADGVTAPVTTPAHRGARAWWPADAQPVITSRTKVTIAPTPPRPLRTGTHNQFN